MTRVEIPKKGFEEVRVECRKAQGFGSVELSIWNTSLAAE